MNFLYPSFLFALSAVIIPIVIHLFHFRRFKKIYFSNITFLEQLSDETQKQARLKHLLVLISRILAIVFLVMAFARPFIPLTSSSAQPGGNNVSIFIDNSFSMESGSVYGSLLDQAKQYAREIVGQFDPTDSYQLLSNDFEPRHQRFISRDEFLAMLNELTFTPVAREIPETMARQTQLLNEEEDNRQKIAFVLSDFQKNIANVNPDQTDSLVEYFLIPFQAERPHNVFIDSVWIENPVRMAGQVVAAEIRIFNDSDQRLENQPVRLYINDVQRAVATFDIDPHEHTTVTLSFTVSNGNIQHGYAAITDHPVIFDDVYYFSFTTSEDIPVLIINQATPNRFVNALLATDSTFKVRNVNIGAIDLSLFSSQNLIILNEINNPASGLIQELSRYVDQGGNLLILPSSDANLSAYNELFAALVVPGFVSRSDEPTRVTALNELHSIYSYVFDRLPENLDLPSVNRYYVIDKQTRSNSQYLMQLQNGNDFINVTPSGQGLVYVSSVPINDEFSNFPRHPMFVPTIYNIALHSTSFYPLSYTIGRDETLTLRNYRPTAGELFRIMADQIDIIPEARNVSSNILINLFGQIEKSGIYSLWSGENLLRMPAFNYDRRESLLESLSTGQINSLAAAAPHDNIFVLEAGKVSFEKQLEQLRGGRQLWKLFLLIALLFLLTEVLLLRFWK